MKRKLGVAATALAALGLLPAGASAASKFQYGVTSSEVTPSSALVWTRAPKAGKLTVEVATDKRFKNDVAIKRTTAAKSHDDTVTVKVTRLKAGDTYFYRFSQGSAKSSTGSFETPPKPSANVPISFAFSGDADAQPAQGQTKPFYNVFEVYKQMARQRNDFNINFGDTIYSDTEVGATISGGVFQPAAPTALTVPEKWAKYKQNLALKNLQAVRSETSMYNQWDDHEFINDFTAAEDGSTIYKAGVAAFKDYMPVTYKGSTGIYRVAHWGKNLDVFFLDERSFRSAKASANHVCDNPQTAKPDLAPTAPQSTRNTFALIEPSLSQPVSPACLAAIKDPNRTMLGKAQLAQFTNAIKSSKAKWKVVMNEVPMQQFYALPYDRWEGYEAERQSVLKTLQGVKNTVVLTTDTHGNLVNDIRYQTLEQGGPIDSGVMEFVTGPVATRNFDDEIDAVTGKKGSGELVRSVFFKPAPPNGVGMKCAATNVYSYTQVDVTSKSIKLSLKDLNGQPVHEPGQNGQPGPVCGPYTLTAK